MTSLTPRARIGMGLALAAALLATRSHHFASLHHMPDASWAAFFLAGVYLRSLWAFPALFAGAALSDFAAIAWGGVSSFCVSPAYVFLIPAYGALWLGGRWYGEHHTDRLSTVFPLAMSVLVSAVVAELLSSGGFYFFSGRFEAPTLAGFWPRFATYFPSGFLVMAGYVGAAAVTHGMVRAARSGGFPGSGARPAVEG